MPHPAPDLIDRLATIVAAPVKADVVPLRVVSPPTIAEIPAVAEPSRQTAHRRLLQSKPRLCKRRRFQRRRISCRLPNCRWRTRNGVANCACPTISTSNCLPLFLEEADDLQREIGAELRQWRTEPGVTEHAQSLSRLLHTLKGSARMAGAMGLGELGPCDGIAGRAIRHGQRSHAGLSRRTRSLLRPCRRDDRAIAWRRTFRPAATAAAPESAATAAAAISASTLEDLETELAAQRAMVRVRAELIDRFVNEAGEISISRTRIEGEMRTLRSSLLDLTENVIRLRNQLREIEIQAESQMQSRLAHAQTIDAEFDPARNGPLHAPAGSHAHDGRVGKRRHHGTAQPVAQPRRVPMRR